VAKGRTSDVERVKGKLLTKAKQREIARDMGVSRSRVANIARISKKAKPEWLQWVDYGRLKLKHVEYVLALRAELADELLRRAMAQRWSTETLRREVLKAKGRRLLEEASKDPNVASLERKLTEKFGSRVAIEAKPGMGGTLTFSFTDNDVLHGLLEQMGYQED
jgi:ParB family chromosome partitioning protein